MTRDDDEGVPSAEEQRQAMRYVTGESTPEEADGLARRCLADPALAAYVEELRALWRLTDRAGSRRDVGRVWTEFSTQLRQPPPPATRMPRFELRPVWFQRRGRIAAVAVAAVASLAVAVGLYRASGWSATDVVAVASMPDQEYRTLPGERAELRLRDGTRVLLGPASRLRVPHGFGHGVRELALEGQGYFEVVHDSLSPFRVRTAHGIAEDLGTAFIVSSYPEIGGMRVVVTAGEVAVTAPQAASRPVILRVGDLAVLDSAGATRLERGRSIDTELAWTHGSLVLRRAPLVGALPQLERWYGVRVRLAAPLLAPIPVSATFGDEGALEALQFVAAAVGGRLEQVSDSVYTLHAR